MSSEFLKGSAKIDRIAADSTNFEMLRENLKKTLEHDGVISRDGFGTRLVPGQEPAPSPAPLSAGIEVREDHRCERVIYPSGNARIVLTGLSEKELDEMEAQIRAAVGGQR